MDEILRQIGQLLISAIPTILCLLIVWGGYLFLVHNKLKQVLEQRHALTQGAIIQAQKEIVTAETRTAEYEERVREARSLIYKAQQARRQLVMDQRNVALAEARGQSVEAVKKARAAVEQGVKVAKATLEQQSNALADQVIETVLRTASAAGGAR